MTSLWTPTRFFISDLISPNLPIPPKFLVEKHSAILPLPCNQFCEPKFCLKISFVMLTRCMFIFSKFENFPTKVYPIFEINQWLLLLIINVYFSWWYIFWLACVCFYLERRINLLWSLQQYRSDGIDKNLQWYWCRSSLWCSGCTLQFTLHYRMLNVNDLYDIIWYV